LTKALIAFAARAIRFFLDFPERIDPWIDLCPEVIKEDAHQMFHHLEINLNFEAVTVRRDYIFRRQCQVRTYENETFGFIDDQDEMGLFVYRFP